MAMVIVFMVRLLDKSRGFESQIDQFDTNKRRDDSADAVDEQRTRQQRPGADGTVPYTMKRQRDKQDDNDRVEDHRRENRAFAATPNA